MRPFRKPTLSLLIPLTLILAACSSIVSQASREGPNPEATNVARAEPTTIPTATAEPTPVPTLADNIRIAGVDVSNLTAIDAREQLEEELSPFLRPLEVRFGELETMIRPTEIDLEIPIDMLIEAALDEGEGARITVEIDYDESVVQSILTTMAEELGNISTPVILTDTDTISRSFALTGGGELDVETAMEQIDERLHASGSSRRVTLSLAPSAQAAAQMTTEQLQQQIEAMAEEWNGVVGIYVYDLESSEEVVNLNADTVFSAASVMKVPMLLQSYVNLESFTNEQEAWIEEMIVESDNLSANDIVAASVGGEGTDDALTGVLEMSDMLRDLGLEHTYQNMPYEAAEYLIGVRGLTIQQGPPVEGPAPFTAADPVLRTTPTEISQVFIWVDECSRNEGLLLETFDTLSPERCQEMLDWLAKNGDDTRMMAGLPKDVRVEHKSGWISDMQADVGIVRSTGGNFVVAIYLYSDIDTTVTFLPDEFVAPVIAHFAELVYSYYNPVYVDETELEDNQQTTPL